MSSPLLEIANAYLLVVQEGVPQVVDGRFVSSESARYLIRCYLKRTESQGPANGAQRLPGLNSPGSGFSGASGEAYAYRGYGILVAEVANDYELSDPIPGDLEWETLLANTKPSWLVAGLTVQHRQGREPNVMASRLTRVTGEFGGDGIDDMVSSEIEGIPLTVLSGEVLN